jgi:nitrate/nitrite transporter NarK
MQGDAIVVDVIVVVYLSGWLLTSAALVVSSRLLTSSRSPAQHPLSVSLLAGGAWLLLLLGAAQFGALVALSKVLADQRMSCWAGDLPDDCLLDES